MTSTTDPDPDPELEAELDRHPLGVVARAIGIAAQGLDADTDHVRALLIHAIDDADAGAHELEVRGYEPAAVAAARAVADRYRRLLPAVDAIAAHDLDTACLAVTAAIRNTDPQPENTP